MDDIQNNEDIKRFRSPNGDLYTKIEKATNKFQMLDEEDPEFIVIENSEYESSSGMADIGHYIPTEEIYATVLNSRDDGLNVGPMRLMIKTPGYATIGNDINKQDYHYAVLGLYDVQTPQQQKENAEDVVPQLPPRHGDDVPEQKKKSTMIVKLRKLKSKANVKYHNLAITENVKKCLDRNVTVEHLNLLEMNDAVRNWFSVKYDKYHVKYRADNEDIDIVEANRQKNNSLSEEKSLRLEDKTTTPLPRTSKKTLHRKLSDLKIKAMTFPIIKRETEKKSLEININEVKTTPSSSLQNFQAPLGGVMPLNSKTLQELRNKLTKTNINIYK